jgi:cell wall-associated NlpC family hydrolase
MSGLPLHQNRGIAKIEKGCTEHNGYCGIDCSGLCWYSGYEGDKDVCYTDAAYLEQYYGFIPNKTFADKENGDMIFVDTNQDGIVDHVGIYVNEWWHTDEMIHATNAEDPDPYYHSYKCSVMYEHLEWRSYWRDYFVDLGRKR